MEELYGESGKIFPGAYGMHMNIEMDNDGPTTFVIESKDPKMAAKKNKEKGKEEKKKKEKENNQNEKEKETIEKFAVKEPNNNIFAKYGRLDAPSELSKSQFIFIRHGKSNSNVFSTRLKFISMNKPRPEVYNLEQSWNYLKYPFL